jgi:hypothetical protein
VLRRHRCGGAGRCAALAACCRRCTGSRRSSRRANQAWREHQAGSILPRSSSMDLVVSVESPAPPERHLAHNRFRHLSAVRPNASYGDRARLTEQVAACSSVASNRRARNCARSPKDSRARRRDRPKRLFGRGRCGGVAFRAGGHFDEVTCVICRCLRSDHGQRRAIASVGEERRACAGCQRCSSRSRQPAGACCAVDLSTYAGERGQRVGRI